MKYLMVRKANKNDLENIYNLVKAFATSFEPEKECFISSFEHILHDKYANIIVAEHDMQIIGYSLGFIHDTFYANGKVAWLEEIMVKEDFRRKGIGFELVRTFEEYSKEKKCKLVALATRRASAFYNSIGYEESATYFRKIL